ncbi:YaaC-like Protein [Lentibacillus halodurans]|uniref:YaaC-like Protein n=1 Tax=Lentibacillus halodurans TaxID=237679 RepID=A0A1I0ZVB1_9BACI|nr:YaaC family protein [Lentibacillus halodurans]SFB29704.1 YaaC-like Protein [Lentibacillus halodurans]
MENHHIMEFFTYLQSQHTAQQYLQGCYEELDGIDASVKSFENCNQFMHYLDHGVRFYENGKRLETLLQPMLFFYGMVHLLKAALLTIRPHYPESTAILAHGVSSRKRKKRDYTFLDDEVKIQHNGLYPYFSEHLFLVKESPFEKIKMAQLFALIPEMTPLFTFHQQQNMMAVGNPGTMHLQFPASVLDNYHLTANAFIKRIKPFLPNIDYTETKGKAIHVFLKDPFRPKEKSPFFTDRAYRAIYFPVHRSHYLPISEIMVHYLLLYNLSMLCRYESEWWGDLLAAKPDMDYPFIKQFLNITAEKIPFMLGTILIQNTGK